MLKRRTWTLGHGRDVGEDFFAAEKGSKTEFGILKGGVMIF